MGQTAGAAENQRTKKWRNKLGILARESLEKIGLVNVGDRVLWD
jgi:hypothetical protein